MQMNPFPIDPNSVSDQIHESVSRLVRDNPKPFLEAVCVGALYFFGRLLLASRAREEDGRQG